MEWILLWLIAGSWTYNYAMWVRFFEKDLPEPNRTSLRTGWLFCFIAWPYLLLLLLEKK